MKYAHLLHAFYGQPWHLRPEYYHNFHAILQRHLAGQEIDGPVIDRTAMRALRDYRTAVQWSQPTNLGEPARPVVGPVDETGEPMIPQMECFGPLAVIPVHGVLGKKLCLIDLLCGGCDYAHISAFVAMASSDPAIQAVLFDFDSPGGMSSGCQECARDIAALTASKPTLAFTEGQCCSAAYWLASQCERFDASATSVVGNVGTILCGEDNSEQWKQEGRKLELFTSSPLKATGADGKPWTEADRAYLQERMFQADARFKSAVRSGRPQLNEAALDGRWFFAENSMELGVVDGIGADLSEVINGMLALVQLADV